MRSSFGEFSVWVVVVLLLASGSALNGAPRFESLASVPAEIVTEALGGAQVDGGRFLDGGVESIDFSGLRFNEGRDREWQAWMEGARTLAIESLPQVPMLGRVVATPPGETAAVRLENLQVEESTERVPMPVEPELYIWQPMHHLRFPKTPVGRYFPGTFIRAADDGSKVNVHLFPVQYDTVTGHVLKLRNADLKIEYRARERRFLAQSTWGSDSVIVTTEAMSEAAQALADFQLERTGVHSEVVTVESVARTEAPIDESLLPDGYKDRSLADAAVVPYNPSTGDGFNYDLARRIDHFFYKRLGDGSPLKYVTILGDAKMVPPSYYYSTKTDFGVQFGVTDWCYGAVNRCGDPRAAVGRLPFQSKEQLDNYLAKVRRWAQYADQARSELSLVAGKAFQSDVFVGELSSLGILNSADVDWFGVHKFFRTKQNYNKARVMSILRGENDSPLVYYLDHGVGNQWFVERDYVSSSDILKIADAGPTVNPVVVAISCSNAAYDEGMFKDVVFAGSQYGPVSIGVASLRSKGGAVAYWGASRPSIGNPIYTIDKNGNLNLTGGNYTLQIMDTFFDRYRSERNGTLGSLTLEAIRAFLFEQGNDMSDPKNVWTYFNMILLGDPTLRFPVRERLEQAYPVARSTTAFSTMGLTGFPEFLYQGASDSFDLSYRLATAVTETVMRITPGGPASSDEVLLSRVLAAGESKSTIRKGDRQNHSQRYFVRLENTQGVPLERQVWFETKVPAAGSLLTRP